MSSKSKSLSEPSNNKAWPATPMVGKLSRRVPKSDVDSPSRSVNSKSTIDRRSPKIATTPEKQATRALKGSEVQSQLSLVQEDLKKAEEKLVLAQREKIQALEELKESRRRGEEANENLKEALLVQRQAEAKSEIEKCRAVDMKQASIEVVRKKEEDLQKEIEALRNQHALDVASLLSATQELQRVKQELTLTCDAKNQALSHADDATKIAEIQAEKVGSLSAELIRLKALLNSKLEWEAHENNRLVSELNSEKETLKQELEKVKTYEEKLTEKEVSTEQLNVELEAAKMAESYARSVLEEWKNKVEDLEIQAEKPNQLERSASESLESITKQLEGSNDLLHDAESEINSLKEKIGTLEVSVGRQRGDLQQCEHRFDMAKEESTEMAKKVECLKTELQTIEEEKTQASNNERLAAASIQTLLEEKNKLMNEVENSRDEEEKSKKAMESLAAALLEISSELREAKKQLLCRQAENDNYETQVEDLKLLLKSTNMKYETMLDNAKHEIDVLSDSLGQARHEFQISKTEWEQKEFHFLSCIRQLENDGSSREKEVSRLVTLLKEAEEEACVTKEEGAQLKNGLKKIESELSYLKDVYGKAKAGSTRLKESLLDKENELRNAIQENEELQTREAASLNKIEGLSKLHEQSVAKKQAQENCELSDSERDYDMLPKVVEFSEQNGVGREELMKVELPSPQWERNMSENPVTGNRISDVDIQSHSAKVEIPNGNRRDNESKEKEEDSVEVDFKMWESCKIEENDFSPEINPEEESKLHAKVEVDNSYGQINCLSSAENLDNGGSSPSRQQHQKNKKPLLHKFGSFLKKKSPSSQK